MFYYQFNIGDYTKSTHHLSNIEDLAYRRLLDLAYDTEKPLDLSVENLARLIRLKNNLTETQQILDEYFIKTKNGYIQKRVKKELDKYSSKVDAARKNGKKGGRPKKTQLVNSANPEQTQAKTKQETRTTVGIDANTHVEAKTKKQFSPPSLELVNAYIAEKNLNTVDGQSFINFYESKGWMVGKTKMKSWQASIRGWHNRDKQKNKTGGNKHETHRQKCDRVFREGTESAFDPD